MARPSKYPPEFRARAVALVLESGRPIKHVADELGVGSESLRQWVRQHEADHGQRTDRPTSVESQELRRLRKENVELKRTNEILRFGTSASPHARRPATASRSSGRSPAAARHQAAERSGSSQAENGTGRMPSCGG